MAFIDSEYEKSKQETCNEYHTDIADLNSTNMADWLEEFELEILRGDGSGAAELRKLRQSQHRRLDCDKSSNPNASDCDYSCDRSCDSCCKYVVAKNCDCACDRSCDKNCDVCPN